MLPCVVSLLKIYQGCIIIVSVGLQNTDCLPRKSLESCICPHCDKGLCLSCLLGDGVFFNDNLCDCRMKAPPSRTPSETLESHRGVGSKGKLGGFMKLTVLKLQRIRTEAYGEGHCQAQHLKRHCIGSKIAFVSLQNSRSLWQSQTFPETLLIPRRTKGGFMNRKGNFPNFRSFSKRNFQKLP